MPPRTKITWLAIGDGASAQLYSVHALPLRVTKVGAALKAKRKATRGPAHNAETRHIAHAGKGHGDHQRHEDVFVEHLATTLEAGATEGKFDHLILVLPPKALAHFRKIVGPMTRKKIKQEIRSEWTHLATPDIEKHLAKRLP